MAGMVIRQPAWGYHPRDSYSGSWPLATHWRLTTCAEVDCPHHLLGWMTIVPAESLQARYIRNDSGRRFHEQARTADGLVSFVFEPGQRCFREHKVQLEREPVWTERRGGEVRRFEKFGDWRDEFNGTFSKLKRERGN